MDIFTYAHLGSRGTVAGQQGRKIQSHLDDLDDLDDLRITCPPPEAAPPISILPITAKETTVYYESKRDPLWKQKRPAMKEKEIRQESKRDIL